MRTKEQLRRKEKTESRKSYYCYKGHKKQCENWKQEKQKKVCLILNQKKKWIPKAKNTELRVIKWINRLDGHGFG